MGEMGEIVPFIVPLGAFVVAIIAIVAGTYGQAHKRRLKAEQRLGMLARGIPLVDVEAVLRAEDEADEDRSVKNPVRRMNNIRITAMILISTGLGLVAFFVVLELVIGARPIFAGAAAGLIPLAIGVGFLIDYRLQKKEIARFGLEAGLESR